MRKFVLILAAAGVLGAQAVMAAPMPRLSAGVATISSESGSVVKAAYHRFKNMKKVHKAQGKGKM